MMKFCFLKHYFTILIEIVFAKHKFNPHGSGCTKNGS